jgi:anti-anti-sigma factor
MSFKLEERNNCTIIHFEDPKLDTLNAAALKSKMSTLVDDGKNRLVFDLSKVSFMESSGMALLLHTNQICRDSAGKLVNFGAQAPVLKVITISQLDKVLSFTDNEAKAVQLCSEA